MMTNPLDNNITINNLSSFAHLKLNFEQFAISLRSTDDEDMP
jgi:hypothetical protein